MIEVGASLHEAIDQLQPKHSLSTGRLCGVYIHWNF
jgi:hypothetical protein